MVDFVKYTAKKRVNIICISFTRCSFNNVRESYLAAKIRNKMKQNFHRVKKVRRFTRGDVNMFTGGGAEIRVAAPASCELAFPMLRSGLFTPMPVISVKPALPVWLLSGTNTPA